MPHKANDIVLFDGYCALCSKAVQFIIQHDTKGRFRFAALQSDKGKSLLAQHHLPADKMDSIVLIKRNKHYLKSSAALHITLSLNGLWPLWSVFLILPPFIRDFVYDIIAKSRYRIFGKNDTCRVPEEGELERFL